MSPAGSARQARSQAPGQARSGCPIFYQPSQGLDSPGIGADSPQVGRWRRPGPRQGGICRATRGIPPSKIRPLNFPSCISTHPCVMGPSPALQWSCQMATSPQEPQEGPSDLPTHAEIPATGCNGLADVRDGVLWSRRRDSPPRCARRRTRRGGCLPIGRWVRVCSEQPGGGPGNSLRAFGPGRCPAGGLEVRPPRLTLG